MERPSNATTWPAPGSPACAEGTAAKRCCVVTIDAI
jgi:hypothetical protein